MPTFLHIDRLQCLSGTSMKYIRCTTKYFKPKTVASCNLWATRTESSFKKDERCILPKIHPLQTCLVGASSQDKEDTILVIETSYRNSSDQSEDAKAQHLKQQVLNHTSRIIHTFCIVYKLIQPITQISICNDNITLQKDHVPYICHDQTLPPNSILAKVNVCTTDAYSL